MLPDFHCIHLGIFALRVMLAFTGQIVNVSSHHSENLAIGTMHSTQHAALQDSKNKTTDQLNNSGALHG
jgi:hypothetical protein